MYKYRVTRVLSRMETHSWTWSSCTAAPPKGRTRYRQQETTRPNGFWSLNTWVRVQRPEPTRQVSGGCSGTRRTPSLTLTHTWKVLIQRHGWAGHTVSICVLLTMTCMHASRSIHSAGEAVMMKYTGGGERSSSYSPVS